MHENEFMKMVERQVAEQPDTLGKLFKFVADHWNTMVEAQRNERESTHRHALQEMLDNLWAISIHNKREVRLFTNLECCTILEAVDAVNPTCEGHSNASRELLDHLAKSFRALGWTPDCEFIKNIRQKSKLVSNLYMNFPEHRIRTRRVK